ncbi:MAG: prepilin-type N-terminal cleavage/methylation domain-containing protein [Candidatus Shapirobacteria bacterium]|nr:prepilin-type N-terminal cleavage/methylation domain-containing protein [Candidatus Shapirobacteria bacterium]
MKNKKNNFGFTLIELLVAITIGMLVVGVGSVSLNKFNEGQKVEAARQEILANLRLARNYAITEQFNEDVPANTDRVIVTIVNGTMVAKSQRGDTPLSGDQTFFSKKINLKNISVTISNPIKFSVTDGRSIDGIVQITVKGDGSSDNISKIIIIDNSGLIYEQ